MIPSNMIVNVDYKDRSIKNGREFVKKLNETVKSKETISRWSYIAFSDELFSDGDKDSIVTGRGSEYNTFTSGFPRFFPDFRPFWKERLVKIYK